MRMLEMAKSEPRAKPPMRLGIDRVRLKPVRARGCMASSASG
jgi:hypothetical protein